jgi:hypothetical protein
MFKLHHALRAGIPAALLATLATSGLLHAQTVQAHYPLLTDEFDATGNYGPILLSGNPTPPALPANGVCVNGIYRNNANGQDVRTPTITTLNMADFQFEVEFQIAALPSVRAPVLMGGNGWRWLGIYVQANGTLGLKHNNSNFAWSTTTVSAGNWHAAIVKYEAGTVQLLLDGALILQAAVGPLNDGNNKNFTTNDFSNGLSHNGCIRNLRISNDTSLAFTRTATGCAGLTITEGGNPTQGGTVTFAIGGPSSTSAIMYGFTPLNLPLCSPPACVLGLSAVDAIPGGSLSLTIPNGIPPGASILFQGIAFSANGCLYAGVVPIAVTDTIGVIIQ